MADSRVGRVEQNRDAQIGAGNKRSATPEEEGSLEEARAYLDARDAEAGGPSACTMMRIVLETGRGRAVAVDGRGLLVRLGEPSGQYLMDARDEERANELAALCGGDATRRVVSLMDAALVPMLGAREEDVFRCNTYVYLEDEKEGVEELSDGSAAVGAFRIRRLNEGWLDVVCAHYAPLPRQAVLHHLRAGWVFGAFDEAGELAGFIGEHDEGSIGMLEVLPAHRRRGCAQALEAFMINRHLGQGRMPYCQVEVSNDASHALQRKMGFTRLPGTQCWVEG